MTTAEYRKLAADLERQLRWHEAADALEAAIAAYPRGGPLARLDTEKMQQRADANRAMP